jgi:hypothetical protein
MTGNLGSLSKRRCALLSDACEWEPSPAGAGADKLGGRRRAAGRADPATWIQHGRTGEQRVVEDDGGDRHGQARIDPARAGRQLRNLHGMHALARLLPFPILTVGVADWVRNDPVMFVRCMVLTRPGKTHEECYFTLLILLL